MNKRIDSIIVYDWTVDIIILEIINSYFKREKNSCLHM